jgi:Uncharacterised methyltransferase family (DUF6094)
LLYLNPPYDSEIGSIADRRMEAVFLERTYRWLAIEGILAFVIPFERLHDCVGVLSSHFAGLKVYRMTEPDFSSIPADRRFRHSPRGPRVRGYAGTRSRITSGNYIASVSTAAFRSCRKLDLGVCASYAAPLLPV